MSAAVWDRRRRGVRLWRAIRRGMAIIARDQDAVVRLPEGLVLISYRHYLALTSVYVTASGRVLTEEDMEALVAEAERGYDVAMLAQRPTIRRDDDYGHDPNEDS